MTTKPQVTITEELIAELQSDLNRAVGVIYSIEIDTLSALLAERASMQSQLKSAALTQENCDLLRKDAERYQWLRGHDRSNITVRDFVSHLYEDGLDFEIDAAMSASPTD